MDGIFNANTFWGVLFCVVIVVVSILALNYAFLPTMDRVEWREELYTVERGDSLWTISRKYCPDNVDPREWIDEIRVLNRLPDATIYPGQRLIVLAPDR